MNLTFYDSTGTDLSGFIEQELYNKLREAFINVLDESELERFDEYLNSGGAMIPTIQMNKNYHISTKNILIGALNNLIYTKNPSDNGYIIEIDPNEIIPNFDAKFIDIANLVNYGTLSVQAYPIFDEVFDLVAEELPQMREDYLEGAQ